MWDGIELTRRQNADAIYRPVLAALGAIDGRPAGGLPQDNDDALSRRDLGLEFRDVTSRVNIALVDARPEERDYRITNTSTGPVDTHLLVIARGLSRKVEMEKRQWPDERWRSVPPGVPAGRHSSAGCKYHRHLALQPESTSAAAGLDAHASVGTGQPVT